MMYIHLKEDSFQSKRQTIQTHYWVLVTQVTSLLTCQKLNIIHSTTLLLMYHVKIANLFSLRFFLLMATRVRSKP